MNALPWLKHSSKSHEDRWIRNVVRKQGHVAGWLWWVFVELMHQYGKNDTLKRDIADVAKAGLTSASVVTRVLTEMASESRVSWTLVGTELQLEIKNYRKWQHNYKSKCGSNGAIEGEGEGEEEEEREEEREKTIAPSPSDSEPPLFTIKATGKKEWHLTASKLAEWSDSYPGVDILAECKRARQWTLDNPTRNKTSKGMPGFLSRWLSKVQDSGKSRLAHKSTATTHDDQAIINAKAKALMEHDASWTFADAQVRGAK